MRKRIGVFMLVFVMVSQAAVIPAQAAPDASEQLNQYSVSLSNVSRGTMCVTFSVFGVGVMDTIGAKQIVIEQQVMSGVWQPVKTFGTQYGYDSLYKGGSLEFTVTPGVIYRATLTAYAKDYDGGSDTGSVSSGTLRAMS